MTIKEVVSKLIGETFPYGDTHEDEKRYKNLQDLEDVAYWAVSELIENSKLRDRQEHSIAKISKSSFETIKELHNMIIQELEKERNKVSNELNTTD